MLKRRFGEAERVNAKKKYDHEASICDAVVVCGSADFSNSPTLPRLPDTQMRVLMLANQPILPIPGEWTEET